MARSKVPAKKQQKRGIDFKKIKRKIGRKLPPPKNATNTEIKSKAIVLPEQSVASEKAGLAVNKKGLTLKELLQQTSHYNPKVRKGFTELRLHKYAVVAKLRERIGDDDRLDNQELLISLMMAYIFNAMTHLAIDVRLMAFKFLELAIQYHPPSFFLNAEKILQSFEDILRRNQFFLEDKGKLKTALASLELCLSLLPCNKREAGSCEKTGAGQGILHAFEPDVPAKSAGQPLGSSYILETRLYSKNHILEFFLGGKFQTLGSGQDDVKYFVLNTVMTEIFLHLGKWICPPVLFEKVLEFLEDSLLGKEKHLISLLPFVPKLVSQVAFAWQSRLLQAFSEAFKDYNPVSPLKLACISVLEELLVPVVLHLLLRLRQRALVNSSFAWEYDNMQLSLQEFFGIGQDDGPDLEQYVLFRIIEVLNSAYKSGHIQIVDHISFLITLLSRFRVFPENIVPDRENDVNISNQGTFKSLSRIVCSCLSQMGDNTLVLQMLEKIILDQMDAYYTGL
ncbi:hypothetical protein D8674_037890 [Pyrus ussuriensis x Pyrus communis]|uniref:Pre-rRNA-processing protein Ipi1 N-terminal domain-containing protein n=1 Tax=Pyrus ussuriensis x Pyrus communis TaxID=2448454 RepID=A0A5N5FTR3_9ROSA|nr:hypothetical protein D8674_037890 [Pyrus ussuriensis x Pyrus communis]